MKKNPQFPHVNSQYGAPMGRHRYGILANQPDDVKAIRLFKVRLDSGGYDEGGAYWGLATGGNTLWCAEADASEANGEEEYREFTRAGTRNGAAHALGILSAQLKSPLTNRWRHRFKVALEFQGDPRGARWYLYEWNQFVQGCCFGSKNEALDYLPELIKEAGDGMEKWL